MNATEIRELFVKPGLASFADEGTVSDARSLALACWELAAQLAEFNDRFERINRAGKEVVDSQWKDVEDPGETT